MVCEKCERKLGTVITPDTWKDGARNTTESGGRKLNENKALTSKKARFDPYGKNKFAICRICKSSVHQPGSHYCQGCAYKKELAFLGCLWMHKLQWRLDPLVPDYQSVIPALDKDRAALLHTFLTSILDHGTFSQQNKVSLLWHIDEISQ
ncbi:cysteine-rich PDZ-binding protein isoform X2 [Anser cygnoides]|uniref:cysteine-rich PDZ-binding protein isoform X2 n=1 Tax=Anser cygnoides TaxID=8845 RepID=UPI000671543F|nr:cysteine-rich PDZ-binding protein isoform X2 [Anser cygnoides]